MEIALGERLGLAGLIMALVAIAVPILWPDKKFIGWVCLLAAFVLAVWWLWVEFHLQIPDYYQKSPTRSTLAVFLTGGIISAGLWLLIMGGKPAKLSPLGNDQGKVSDSERPQPHEVEEKNIPSPKSSQRPGYSEEEKRQIVEALAVDYQKIHPEAKGYSQPMVNWINKRLKKQNTGFSISLKPPQKSQGIVVTNSKDVTLEDNTIVGFDEAIVIHSSEGVKAKGNTIIPPKRP